MTDMYRKKIQADVDVIFSLLAQRVDEKQLALAREAYRFAEFAHRDQSASQANHISVIRWLWHAS